MMLNINAMETELALDALRFFRDRLANESPSETYEPAQIMAAKFTSRRINELIARIEALRPRP